MRLRLAIALSFLLAFGRLHAQTSLAERYLFQVANLERQNAGLPPLQWNPALYQAARQHAQRMANAGTISHQFANEPGVAERSSAAGAHFSAIAENVAMASTATLVHEGWMNSPHHRENILDSRMNSLGVAVVVRGRDIFAVQDFGRDVTQLTLDQQEAAVVAQLQRIGIADAASSQTARVNCSRESGFVGSPQAGFIMRWTATELDALPDALTARIQTRPPASARVGACSQSKGDSFSTYRIAVLLY